ncbi:hypothetical protein C8Q76DRAFT_748384 [Earliella scabrosa]|nr:hypothetical protein C8Q76DRAFT_749351 [Earliella scabrosa]KAI0707223.1 hypothetical protein C8Q76DRAFT_748384 [Earliella scabrosa]
MLDLTIADHTVGSGPLRTLMRAAVARVVADESIWQPRGRFHAIRWGPYSLGALPRHREVKLKVAGYVALLHMIAVKAGPDPVSPFLLRLAIEGGSRASRIDHAFMQLLEPDIYHSLGPWIQHDMTKPLPAAAGDPLFHLIIDVGLDHHALSNPPDPDEIAAVESRIFGVSVLGCNSPADHPDLHAFAAGLAAPLAIGSGLAQTFASRCRDYLATMCNHRLDDPEVLVTHLEFRSALDAKKIASECERSVDMPLAAWDFFFEEEFVSRLLRYLRGRGHPDHPDVRAVVGEERFLRDRDDPLLRARLFLHMMSGSDLIPNGSSWKLKLFFRHEGLREQLDSLPEIPIPAPIDVHACFYEATVLIDNGVRNLLSQPQDPQDATAAALGQPAQASTFEAWIHGAVLQPEDYNSA